MLKVQARKTWLPVSLSRRTLRGPVLTIPLKLTVRHRKPRSTKAFRNPVINAMELRDRMAAEGINRAELARRLGVSRARVTQWLELLELPETVIRQARAKGDNWEHRLVTERELRTCRKKDGSERGQQSQKPALQIRQARFDDLPDKVDIDT